MSDYFILRLIEIAAESRRLREDRDRLYRALVEVVSSQGGRVEIPDTVRVLRSDDMELRVWEDKLRCVTVLQVVSS